ncbi:unnamed protein product [Brassica oleracea]
MTHQNVVSGKRINANKLELHFIALYVPRQMVLIPKEGLGPLSPLEVADGSSRPTNTLVALK